MKASSSRFNDDQKRTQTQGFQNFEVLRFLSLFEVVGVGSRATEPGADKFL